LASTSEEKDSRTTKDTVSAYRRVGVSANWRLHSSKRVPVREEIVFEIVIGLIAQEYVKERSKRCKRGGHRGV